MKMQKVFPVSQLGQRNVMIMVLSVVMCDMLNLFLPFNGYIIDLAGC